jgi:pSer/pThr/pTyr-binding forkhead associated (FHA) protein
MGAGAAPIGLLIGRRRRRPPADTERSDVVEAETGRQIIYAVLQNIDNGKSTPVTVDRINIGRANGNDIVIDDEAVSREHAVLLRQESGSFVIENKGSNGTSVNHLRIEQAELADGDLITMGDTTLRFVQTKA